METVNIQKVFKKEWNGKTFYDVTLADGRKGSCNDERIEQYKGQSISLELKRAKMYNGVQQYYFNFPKAGVEPMKQITNHPSDSRGQTQLDRIEAMLVKICDHLMPPF